jgi:hypothetical protein
MGGNMSEWFHFFGCDRGGRIVDLDGGRMIGGMGEWRAGRTIAVLEQALR